MHILPNTSRGKDDRTMKFSQVIEYNMKNIFLEKSCTKFGGETSPRPFSKKQNFRISLDQQSEIYYSFFFLLYVQVQDFQNILKLRC